MSSEHGCERSRTLIVHKDEAGYGLTLCGDKPTRVQTVKSGGASDRAGVREGDVIIKVNGQQVTDSNHGDVVQLIQRGSYVALTVVHSSRFIGGGAENMERRESRGDITGPSPANNEAERRLLSDKMHTLQLMIEQQSRVVEELRSSLARSNSKKVRAKLDAALKSLQDLEAQQSVSLKHSPERVQGSSVPTTPSSALPPFPPVAPPRVDPIYPVSGLPPQLPPRNKADSTDPAPAPPPRNLSNASLPPPPPSSGTKFYRYSSNENLHPTSPDSVMPSRRGSQAAPPSPAPQHTRTRSSPVSLERTLELAKSIMSGVSETMGGDKAGLSAGQKSPRYETPPGTPPPPYIPQLVTWGNVTGGGSGGVPNIISMESDSDDGEADGEARIGEMTLSLPPEGDHGPFNSLTELMNHPAHLAVFLNYVLSNTDPSPLLFYLISDAYKSGPVKEMRRKWAYEIHSCFLVPRSPLELPNLDENDRNSIDKMLSDENSDQLREENLTILFWKVISKTRQVLKLQLDEFRATRAAGLGNIFGPADPELKLCDENQEKRMTVINERLVPMLETMAEDIENATDRNSTLCSSLATVLSKIFNTKDPKALAIIDKIPTFVSKEKKRERIFGRDLKKEIKINNHKFILKHYDQVTYCNQSHQIIWGIGPQGYQCSYCNFDVYKKFVTKVEEICVGPSHEKSRADRRSGILPGLFGKLPGNLGDVGRTFSKDQLMPLDPSAKKHSSVSPSPSVHGRGDLGGGWHHNSTEDTTDSSRHSLEPGEVMATSIPEKVTGSSLTNSPKVGGIPRSASLKDGTGDVPRRNRGQRPRKHSDPMQRSVARSSLEADPTVSKSGSSSEGSISDFRTWDPTPSTPALTPSRLIQRQDSEDIESETSVEQTDWRNSLSADELASLSTKEAKRQDVINELFNTERSHVMNMKTLERVFRTPLLDSGLMPQDVVERLFPNLDEVIQIHSSYNSAMRSLKRGGFPIMEIGEMLSDMFLGSYGDRLISAGAEFTKNQEATLSELKKIRARDSRIEAKLVELELDPGCRRLQLHDMLAWEHQRLVKYPLLLEQIVKHSDAANPELDLIKEVTVRTREILDNIDKEVAQAQNIRKLEEMQRVLDTSGLEKLGQDNPVCLEYRNIDLTKLRLIHDGQLTLNLGGENKRVKNIELQVLLLEDCVMFLQKQDEKYLLKFHTGSGVAGTSRDDVKKILSPVIKFTTMLVRPVATNKRAFYLMNTTQMGAQLYELVASSSNERSTWLTHIQEASNAFKSRGPRVRPTNSASNISFVQRQQQVFEGSSMDMTDRRGSGPGTGRSQSFNEQSLRHRELINRPLPSLPIEKEIETLDHKIEKLSRKDEEVARALEEKQKIIADIFNIPPEDYETITDLVVGGDNSKDAKDVLLAVMAQADCLARCVNECLKVSDESEAGPEASVASAVDRGVRLATPPSDKLVTITTNMNTNLTALLSILQDQEEEKQRWRRELAQSQEQVRAIATSGSDSHSFRSRPDSFISMESDIASEQDRSEHIEIVEDSAGPSSSTPMKDSTPTNDVCDNIDEEEEIMGQETGEKVVQIGEIVDEKDIVESSDC